MLCGISSRFQLLSPSEGQVAHALLTRSPLSLPSFLTEISKVGASFDLHVLGMPPAFILSQDQTLHLILTLFFFSLLSVLIVFQVSQEIDVISVSLVLVRLFFSFLSSFQRSSLP